MLRDELTPRQLEVANLIAWGWSNTQVGLVLGISRFATAQHAVRIYERLGIEDQCCARLKLATRYARECLV